MCGICGVAGRDPRAQPILGQRLMAMTTVMSHRGPDEEGHGLDAGIALGMRRLSVIDLEASHQPLANEDRTVHTVFNGEIFNFRQLRRDLQAKGHRMCTAGDSETIVHLYEDHGPRFAEKLRGMFGIAVWDHPRRRLVLARDRLGVKPLYYATTDEGLCFASEIKSLFAGDLVVPRLDTEAARLFMTFGYVPGERTLFLGVKKLAPGTILVWEDGKLVGSETYWTPEDAPTVLPGSWEEDEEHLLGLLRSAVKARMVSDVPLGVMLSGGLDSSLIAALMAEASSGPINTFSIGFEEDENANELTWARMAANRIGARHHELLTSASEHEGLLDDALWHLEEPVADLSFLGFFLLSKLAHQTVTVALCGQGADELLAGYPKHRAARMSEWTAQLPAAFKNRLRQASSLTGEQTSSHRLLAALGARDDYERLLAMSRVITPTLYASLAGPALGQEDPGDAGAQALLDIASFAPDDSRLKRVLMLDLQTALPDLMFMYFDKMSMAASLEVRVPFADHDVVSFCMALSDRRKMRRFRGKEILRRVSKDLVDESIINRPKRGFFRATSSSWLAHHRKTVAETLLDQRCRNRGLLEPTALRTWLSAPLGEGRGGEPLLVAFLLEKWHRLYLDADGLAAAHSKAAQAEAASLPAPASMS